MPRISSTVHHQLTAASVKSRAMSPSRARAAAKAGARPAAPGERSSAEVIKRSGGPRELGGGEARLPLVGDAERVDVRPRGLRHRQVRRDRVEHPVEAHRLPRLDAERHDVLDLEVDRVSDADAVANTVLDHLERGSLDTDYL